MDDERLCGPITITIPDGIGGKKIDVCAVVFHYNPVDFPSAMTAGFTSDGESQRHYNVPWPLSKTMCPVRVTTHDVPRNQGTDRVFMPTVIDFDLSLEPTIARNWFKPKADDPFSALESHNPPPSNNIAYQDIWFSGICEEWGMATETGQGSWFQVNSNNQTVHYDSAGNEINQDDFYALDNVDACIQIHLPSNAAKEPVPENISNGTVRCYFMPQARATASANGFSLLGLYGVVAERADCQGSFSSTESLYSSKDFDLGQLDYGRLNGDKWPAVRKVCDKCARCGGYNQGCDLGCDGLFPSHRKLDLCGPPFCEAEWSRSSIL